MAAIPLRAVPQSSGRVLRKQQQFLVNGPKECKEFKSLENKDIFVRMDFPGVPEEGLRIFVLPPKFLTVYARAPKVHKHDSIKNRTYVSGTKLSCECCHITSFTSQISDGVLRLLISKANIDPQRSPCTSLIDFGEGNDVRVPVLVSGLRMDPYDTVYESKQLEDGSLYVRLDMPGVPKDNFTVSVASGRVKVTGQAPAVSHDSDGRFYSGDVAMLSSPVDVPSRRIKTIIKNGVIRLLIPPV